ncbi:hypothetical protein [Paenibacillus sp. NPDC057967]|uniref:hypothetical protein n=1 Tax=Paenibacillus sp. NPDC057967 TaxID=3346293 RepID=UPI0036DAD54B
MSASLSRQAATCIKPEAFQPGKPGLVCVLGELSGGAQSGCSFSFSKPSFSVCSSLGIDVLLSKPSISAYSSLGGGFLLSKPSFSACSLIIIYR